MIRARLTYHGDMVDHVFEAGWEGIVRATLFAHQKVSEAIGIPNSGVRKRRKRTTSRGARGSTYTVYPNPSKPGEPPRKRTGWLQAHVRYEFDKAQLRSRIGVGVNAKYGLWLELGTKKMAARPWLWATIQKIWPQLVVLAAGQRTP